MMYKVFLEICALTLKLVIIFVLLYLLLRFIFCIISRPIKIFIHNCK